MLLSKQIIDNKLLILKYDIGKAPCLSYRLTMDGGEVIFV